MTCYSAVQCGKGLFTKDNRRGKREMMQKTQLYGQYQGRHRLKRNEKCDKVGGGAKMAFHYHQRQVGHVTTTR